MALLIVLSVVIGATLVIAWYPARKEAVALAAVALLLVVGHGVGFFRADQAFASISVPVLLILIAIGIFATVFAESGVFERTCRTIAVLARGDGRILVPAFLLFTYVLSCLLPNLTCLYVLLPLMIGSLRAVGMEAAPLRRTIVAIVIASNLGGASTMIGDFPNILISRSQGIPFVEFLLWMAPACVIMLFLLGALAWQPRRGPAPSPLARGVLTAMLHQQREDLRVDWRLFVPAALTFTLMIAGLVGTGWVPFPPELVCLATACLCVWMLPRPESWATRIDVQSTLFIACLFIFAGAIQSTGALDRLARAVVALCQNEPHLLAAAVIALAFVLTAFFSAGPTTAVLIPIAESLQTQLPGHSAWWCLSLGVLAGSSTTLLSATAGPIAANLLKHQTGLDLTYGDFLRVGGKVGVVFCLAGTTYMWIRL